MLSNRHRSPFPGASAWPAHNNHISLLFNLLLLPAHNNPMYAFRCCGVEPVGDYLAVVGLFISPSTHPLHLPSPVDKQKVQFGSQVILHFQIYNYHGQYITITITIKILANMITIVIIKYERPRRTLLPKLFQISNLYNSRYGDDCCHH